MRVMKSEKIIKLMGHSRRMKNIRIHKVLVGKSKTIIPVQISRRRCKNNIKKDLHLKEDSAP